MKSLGAPVLGDARYAAAADAAAEERAYLHCAALRFVAGGEPVQIVCRPDAGSAWLGEPGFDALFDRWFPPAAEEDLGDWFAGAGFPLLRSSLGGGALGGAALGGFGGELTGGLVDSTFAGWE
jgi:hypothetical protein